MCNDEEAEGGRAGSATYPTTTTFNACAMMTALLKQRRRVSGDSSASVVWTAAKAQERDAVSRWVRDVAVSWCERLIGLLRWTGSANGTR
jgi:hypothetical protein